MNANFELNTHNWAADYDRRVRYAEHTAGKMPEELK